MRRDDIQDLREKRAATFKQMSDLTAKAKEESRDFTAEEEQEYEKMRDDFEAKAVEIRRSSQLMAMKNELEDEKQKVFMPAGQKAAESLAEYRALSGNILPRDVPEY